MKIQLNVNDKDYVYEFHNEEQTLLSYLRDILHFTAVKNGCNKGHCGACTVVLDGKAVLACRKYLRDLDGAHVITLESLSDEESVHPIIYSFVREGAVQCGFCTPGFIMSSKALLDQNNSPNDMEIRKALTTNICRCTGYVKIIEAVKSAGELIRKNILSVDRKTILPGRSVSVGESVIRIDSLQKACGETLFADDIYLEDMLYAKVLRSPHSHAEILKIDTSEALKSSGVVKVLLAGDIPGQNRFGPIKKDQPVLNDRRVLYIGDAVVAVYAESEEEAETALAKIRVDYRELPSITEISEALVDGAPVLHGEDNIIARMESGRGNLETGFKKAEFVIEDVFHTQYVEHGYLEPESCIARLNDDGLLTISVASQGPPMDALEIAPVIGFPPEKIQISGMPMGGGFGGKEDISVQIIASLGAVITGRPVKYTFTREESISVSGKRNATELKYRLGADSSGRITAVEVDIVAKGGAYASVEEAVILRSVSFAAGPYTIPAADVKARAVYLNHAPACAMRGFGNPTVSFGSEMMMNMMADSLNLDPIEFRLKNILEPGKPTITGDRPLSGVGITSCLKAVQKELALYRKPEPREGWEIGIGIAASYKNVGLGIGMDDSAGAYAKLLPDGSISLHLGSVDMGQGSNSAMAQIFSDSLGWPFNLIVVHSADTARDPLAGMTTASRQTFISGNAVLKLSGNLKDRMFSLVAEIYDVDKDNIELRDRSFIVRSSGKVIAAISEFADALERKQISVEAVANYSGPRTSFALIEPEKGYESPEDGRLHAAYCYAAQATVLEVNRKTGKVNVLDVIIASDVGRIINRASVEGQMEGGVVMGLGYALSEQFVQREGRIVTDSYARLGIRRIGQTPRITCIIIEEPHDDGPYGAKGMGELPLSMGAPSVSHAIYDALGIWIKSIPAIPEKILAELNKSTESGV